MLEKEFKYYRDNQEALVQQYPDKFLVIRVEQVEGAYNSQIEAYNAATKQFELGTFLIQHCQPGKVGYTQTFHTRAIINRAL